MAIRLGEIMVEHGLLTREQVELILMEQQNSRRPFGLLAESMFGISPQDVEDAWAEQYSRISPVVDLAKERFDPEALKLVSRRQAWQFQVLPIRFDASELMIATTGDNLARALRFTSRCLMRPCYFVLAEGRMLGEALAKYLPLPGLSAEVLAGAADSPWVPSEG